MIFLTCTAVLAVVLVVYLHLTYSKFSDYGVKHLQPFPFFGNMLNVILGRRQIAEEMDKMYKKFRGERFFGRYEFIKPTVVVRDLDLVKKVTIKDFEHFLDHRSFIDEKIEPIFSRNLFSLRGQEWKDMRSTLSPAFTSSKIKLMVPFMEEVGEQMIRALKNTINQAKSDCVEVNVKDLTSRYTNDVIASCAFGLKVNSHTDKENQFYEMGKVAASFKFYRMMLFFFSAAFPGIANKLKLKIFPSSTKNFFIELVTSTIKYREAHQIIRPDMIHFLMEAKKGQLSHDDKSDINSHQDTGFATVKESLVKRTVNKVWSDNDLIAQAVLFFVVGFETISTATSFALHELALNPEIQERLVREIKEHNTKNGGKLDFNSIQNLTYLDMVTSETFRLWPPAVALDRVCVKDYNMGKPYPKATKDYIIRKGDILAIPVWSFHRDPELFPDPEKYDPERFSEENKHNINPLAYMPFGIGPRNCIGSKFALCEFKILLYQILLNTEVLTSEKTCLPSKLAPNSFNLRLQGGHWLKFKNRC